VKNIFKRSSALILCLLTLFSLVACGGTGAYETESGTKIPVPDKYTYNDYLTAMPTNWNPHKWLTDADSYVMDLISIGLYTLSLNETRDAYVISPEMAEGDPQDVTADYKGNVLYKIPENAESGYAYKISLNQNACWEDGSVINADTYINSMKMLLSSSMKNKRASNYMSGGNLPIANADAYYNNDKADQPIYKRVYDGNVYADVDENEMYASLTVPSGFFGTYSAAEYYEAGYVSYFYDENGTDLFAKYSGTDYIPLTEEVIDDLKIIANNFEEGSSDKYRQFCFYISGSTNERAEWESVGLIKSGNYEITVILESPVSTDLLKYRLCSNWIVNEASYSAHKFNNNGMSDTSYCKTVESTVSYGPYKLSNIGNDGTLFFERNNKWYGYSDGKHEGQYQTDSIICAILPDNETALELFLAGSLDKVVLGTDAYLNYSSSPYLLSYPESYTSRLTFNSDKDALKIREIIAGDGINKTIMAYDDFRKAISFSLDRTKFCNQCAPTGVPAYALFSPYYSHDLSTGVPFRETDTAISSMCLFYDVNEESEINTYNKALAADLFDSAYRIAAEAGDIKEGDTVELEFLVYNSDAAYSKIVNFVADSINEASKGTALEGRIKFKLTVDPEYYSHARDGQFEIIMSTTRGSVVNMYNTVKSFCDPDILFEYGFLPTVETLIININGDDTLKTYYEWYVALTTGEYANSDPSVKLRILAAIERGIMENYCTTPLYYFSSYSLRSKKVLHGTDKHISGLGYGGIRYLGYAYTDAEWLDFCSENVNISYK